MLPSGWLAGLPGTILVAAHAKLLPASETPLGAATLATLFDGNIVVGGEISGGAGLGYTDFRIHPDGFVRFVGYSRSLSERQAGRRLQRLFEIEAYRTMALLALTRDLFSDMPVQHAVACFSVVVQRAVSMCVKVGQATRASAPRSQNSEHKPMPSCSVRWRTDATASGP
ncbi:MAG: DUF3422 family protein [Ramlibacter sp.]|nr:DUF3422 family protein [Ramlibacter sp.]